MSVDTSLVKELRERTGAGIMECKQALLDAGADTERAIELLRERGIARAARKQSREAKCGLVYCYTHAGSQVGSMVELNCETDFVARTEDFQALAKEVAMQVAAMAPEYVAETDVPEPVLQKEKEFYRRQTLEEGKPETVVDRIVEGKLSKFYDRACLLRQPYIKDDKKTVADLIKETIAKVGENVVVGRFARFRVGEG